MGRPEGKAGLAERKLGETGGEIGKEKPPRLRLGVNGTEPSPAPSPPWHSQGDKDHEAGEGLGSLGYDGHRPTDRHRQAGAGAECCQVEHWAA